MSVNIQVTAQTAQATANMQEFAKQTGASLNQVAAAGANAAQAMQRVVPVAAGLRTTASALQAFGRAGSLIGYQVAPQLTATIGALTNGYKALTGAMAISGAGIAATGTAVIGVAAIVATGVSAWQAYKAKLQEVAAQAAKTKQEIDFRDRNSRLPYSIEGEMRGVKCIEKPAALPERFQQAIGEARSVGIAFFLAAAATGVEDIDFDQFLKEWTR